MEDHSERIGHPSGRNVDCVTWLKDEIDVIDV
jgi:hypothetical protein